MSLDWKALSDGELAALSVAGRQGAFAEIMHRYGASIFRLTRAWLGDEDEAMDLSQETFVAAHRALARYDPSRPMRTWLSAIALNKCRDWGRKRAVRRFLSFAMAIGPEAEAVVGSDVPLDDAASDREELARVMRAIAALPATLKEPLVLRTVENLSQAETARILSISEKAVETRLYRARAKLLEILRSSEG